MIVGNINYFNKGVGYVCTFLERDLENSRNYFSELTPWILKGHWEVNNFLLIHKSVCNGKVIRIHAF